MQTTKQVTRVTPEGFIVEVATNGVIGFKCQGCSTAHIAEDNLTQEQFVDYIFNCQETHKSC